MSIVREADEIWGQNLGLDKSCMSPIGVLLTHISVEISPRCKKISEHPNLGLGTAEILRPPILKLSACISRSQRENCKCFATPRQHSANSLARCAKVVF